MYNLVENNDADDIFKDDINYITNDTPAKNVDEKINRIVKSNKEATRAFFCKFMMLDSFGE